MRIGMLVWLLAVVAGSATAQTMERLCCGTKTCPAGTVQVRADQCCTNEAEPSTCTTVANLGKRCNDDLAAALSGIPDRGNVAGCAEVPGVACVGGQIADDSGPVAGCVCIADACEADFDFPNGKPDCTAIAVDACCAADACL
ncbi:MAG: hypothetical protein ACREQQ_00970 [Candidatus Binatia bacterium]